MPFSFEDLEVYQKSLDFSVSVIDVVDQLDTPRKHYRLIEQLESSSSSIALNISEGKGRYSKKEFRQFLYIALGSCAELETQIEIAVELKYIDEQEKTVLLEKIDHESRMLRNLIKKLN